MANGPPRLRRAFLAIHSDGLFCLYLDPPLPTFSASSLLYLPADVLRLLGRKQRYGIELERALAQLKKEERINFLERSPATGGTTYTVTPIPISFFGQTL